MREFELLQTVYGANGALPEAVKIPPGDDMGAIALRDWTLLVTVDQLADGVHVDVANTAIERVGRKAVTRNLSDVAAMAAWPVGAVAGASLPKSFGEVQATELFEAMRATAAAFGCPLIGGDVSMWDHPMLLSVTVFAEPRGIEPVLRSGAKVGDGVFVTGELGGSFESEHHLDFEPRVELARSLAGHEKRGAVGGRPSSMIDLSDGLASDLGHVCSMSGVSALIDATELPIRSAGNRSEKLTWKNAVGDGEDYELLFTIPGNEAGSMPSEIDGIRITRVGTIVEAGEHPVWIDLACGARQPLTGAGWEHGR